MKTPSPFNLSRFDLAVYTPDWCAAVGPWQQCLRGSSMPGPGRAVHCQAHSSASVEAARGAQGGPGPWTPPGPLRRVSQHSKRENTCQGACRDSVRLHLLFFPAVAKVAPPRLGAYGPNITLVLRKLFHFCLLSIKVPVPSPSLASPAVKAHTSSPLLTSLALWLSCIHPSIHPSPCPTLPPAPHPLLLYLSRILISFAGFLWPVSFSSPLSIPAMSVFSTLSWSGVSTPLMQDRNQGDSCG